MFGVILGLHILICLSLIIVVLLQSGKGGGLAGAFGGAGGVGAVFGGQTAATFLTKATRYLAIAFMLTSLTLAFTLRLTSRGGGAITQGLEARQAAPATSAGEEVVPSEGMPALPGAAQAGQEQGGSTEGSAGATQEPGGATGEPGGGASGGGGETGD
jgi:preprotein translocase subunit SecG